MQHDYSYDAASRLKKVWQGVATEMSANYSYLTNSAQVQQVAFRHNGTNRLVTDRSFDSVDRLTLISSAPSAGSTISFDYALNAASQRTSVTNGNSAWWNYGYDALGQVTSGKRQWSDGTWVAGQQFEYSFDDIGNRRSAAAGGDEWGANLRYQNYTANSLNQYTQRTVPGYVEIIGSATNTATVTVNNQPTYRKDSYYRAEVAVGNSTGPVWQAITNLAVIPQGTNADIVTNYTGNVLVPPGTQTFSFDADGNLTNDGVWAYTWDAENRLLSMISLSSVPSSGRKSLKFGYDFQGRRVSKVVSNWTGSAWSLGFERRFLYDDWNLITELTSANGTVRQYMWGTDMSGTRQGAGGVGGLVKVFDVIANVQYFPAFDGNGNVAALARSDTGTVDAEYEYGPFGELLRSNGAMATNNPIRFSTKYQDAETEMLYYGYRYYQPTTGRWLSPDPLTELAFGKVGLANVPKGRSDSNPYRFVRNNPASHADMLGLLCIKSCPCGEEATAINAVGAIRAFRAWRLSEEAKDMTRRTGLRGGMNGPADAFRHCYWSCRMAQELSTLLAEIIGDIHERCRSGKPAENAMDLANNKSGRDFATRGADCYGLCLGAVYEGSLVLSPVGIPPSLMYCY